MGGFGSGRYGHMPRQKRPKTTVEKCLCLDIGSLYRKGLLTPFNILTMSWSYAYAAACAYATTDHEDRPAGSIDIIVLDNALRLSYAITDKDSGTQRNYSISAPIEWIPCTYGGARPYFTCPDCHRRVLKIYKPPSHAKFSCRYCYDLTYRSCQNTGDDHARARARTRRACRKLGITDYRNYEDAYYKAYVLERPKGMHKKTFERLRQAVFEAVYEEEEAYRQALYTFAEKIRRRNRKFERYLAGKNTSVS
jgi:hypothetical protein